MLHAEASCSAFQCLQGCTARLESETNGSGSVFHRFCLHGHGKCHSLGCRRNATHVFNKRRHPQLWESCLSPCGELSLFLKAGSWAIGIWITGRLSPSLCCTVLLFPRHKSSFAAEIRSVLYSFENFALCVTLYSFSFTFKQVSSFFSLEFYLSSCTRSLLNSAPNSACILATTLSIYSIIEATVIAAACLFFSFLLLQMTELWLVW